MKSLKKVLLVAMMLTSGMANVFAQDEIDNTFRFVDRAGNVIPDGGTYTCYAVAEELAPGVVLPLEAKIDLFVENTTGDVAYVAAQAITVDLPNGKFQFCFPKTCPPTVPEVYDSEGDEMVAGEKRPLFSEWYPENGKYGTAVFTVQLKTMDLIDPDRMAYDFVAWGPKITVKCIYADPAGIDGVYAADGDAVTNVYDMAGRPVLTKATADEVSALGKGLYICETVKNGKTAATKKIMK